MSLGRDTRTRITAPPDAYSFGKNWQRYIREHLSPERIHVATSSLSDFLGTEIQGKSFLDIGSGSGLFSLGAYELGARQVTSIDVDRESVAATSDLRRRAGEPANWTVMEGSILDPRLIHDLPSSDIVYSWGVLHHTGDMYTALRHAAALVKPGGLFCIAIYNRVTGRFLDSHRWWWLKRQYNHSSGLTQRGMELGIRAYWLASTLHRGQNPFRAAREYTERGMAVTTDLLDWIGGYPFEYATVQEIVAFCRSECDMVALKTVQLPPRDNGLNKFLFRRVG